MSEHESHMSFSPEELREIAADAGKKWSEDWKDATLKVAPLLEKLGRTEVVDELQSKFDTVLQHHIDHPDTSTFRPDVVITELKDLVDRFESFTPDEQNDAASLAMNLNPAIGDILGRLDRALEDAK